MDFKNLNLGHLTEGMRANQKQTMVLVGVGVALLACLLIMPSDDAKQAPRSRKGSSEMHVITDKKNRNLGNDALAAKIDSLSKEVKRLRVENDRLTKDISDTRGNDALERQMRERFEKMNNEIARLRDMQSDNMMRSGGSGNSGGISELGGEAVVENPFERPARVEDSPKDFGIGNVGSVAPKASSSSSLVAKVTKGKRSNTITVVSEDESPSKTRGASKKKGAGSSTVNYIPAGSILTGTLVTGGDFPTGSGGKENPMPVLVRLTKTAILPNRYQSDVRECFMLMSGHGDLSSERAKFRGETLSCIRHDGGVINTRLSSYVAGEDGKEGIKGRLVSKQGQMIARTMVAGFLSGISKAFDYTPVEVLSTTSTGSVQYQSNFSADAVKGGLARGASNAAEKVANFFAKLADSMVPVVEVTPGRQVDIIVVSGAKIDASFAANVKRDKTASIED